MATMQIAVILWLGTVALLPAAMWALSAAVRGRRLSAELARKLLHVGGGIVLLVLPVQSEATVSFFGLLAAVGVWFYVMRRFVPLRRCFGAALYSVPRSSRGELFYLCGIGATGLIAAGDRQRFLLSLAILVFADSAAAVIGMCVIRRHEIGRSRKSVEGCTAFFVVALICATVSRWCNDPVSSGGQVLLFAVPLACLCTVLEACGRAGFDNFLVPVGAACLIPLLQAATPPALAFLASAMLTLVAVAVLTLRYKVRQTQ